MKEHSRGTVIAESSEKERSPVCLDCAQIILLSDLQLTERRILDEYFPLTTTRGERQPRAAEKTERRHAIMVEEDEAEGLRPGEHYMIYNTQDVLGAVPEDYAFVVRHAADWTGVDEEYIYGVIETYERRLARWWEGLKRRRSRSMERKREDRELL